MVFTLGPNCTSNVGYKTTDSSLDIIIEISKVKHIKTVSYKSCYKYIRTGALFGATSKKVLAIKA